MAYNRSYYFNFQSDAEITWRLEMYDQIATSTYQDKEGTLGPKASEMKYGSEGSKMFAPLKPSTFSFEFMVTDQASANYIKQLKTSRQERDVYVALYRETVTGANSPQYRPYFAGQVLMDLSDDPDIPLPYPITIKAVDGIASLKYYDYVPSTTSQLASHIYDLGETYIPDPTNVGGQYDAWQHCIEIISNCLAFSGEFTTGMGNPTPNLIFTNVRWFNGEHPNTTIDPLRSTRIKPNMFYTEENEGEDLKYKAKNCYDVLQNLCKAWGMRMYYFSGIYYFTQLNNFRKVETGTQLNPVNIKRHSYNMDGSTQGSGNAINRWWGKYQMPLTNQVTTGEYKNHKLAGGKYGLLPAFKRVTIDFMNVDNVNSFTSFPLLPTGGIAPVSNGLKWEFSSLGTFTFDGINDQQFFNRINMQVSNQGVNAGQLTFGWALVARPAGAGSDNLNQSPSNNGWTKYMYLDVANSPPVAWGTGMGSLNSGSMPHNPTFNIGIGNTLVDITAGGIANYPFFPASVFTAGQWEIGYYAKTEILTTQSVPHSYWSYNGRFVPDSVANPLTNPYMNGVTYTNTGATTGINASEFAPIINGAIGSASTTTNLYQTGDDTAYEEVNDIIMGDTGSNFSEGCIQIYTGSVWKASDFAGFWGIDTLAGGNSFSQQLAEDIFKAQSKSIDKFTLSTTIDASESIYWNDGTANRPQWACPFTKFMTQPNALQGMVQKAFIMHTGTYDFLTDTWKWVLYQQAAFTVGATVTTTNTLGVNSGLSGYGGSPSPVGGGPSALVGPPNPISGTGNSIRLLNQQQIQPVAIIRAGQYLAQGTEVQSITVTSLSVKQLPAAIFKIGDKLVLQTKSNDNSSRISESNPQYNTNRIEFVVSANQLINATTISVTSKTIYQDISVGDTITFNAANLYSQYQNKTEGSVAGFEVDADGLTKDGVEITGWLNSDTMTGASVNNLPTALSVKNYVDNSHPAEDQTLQEVTDNGNTTTNAITFAGGTSTGNLGIGTTAPSEKIQVNGVLAITANDTAYAANYFTKIKSNYSANPFIIESKYGDLIKAESYGKALSFHTGESATAERLRILSNGNVGIGTTAPATKFEVVDNSSGGIRLSHANGEYIQMRNSGTVAYLENTTSPLFVNSGADLRLNATTSGSDIYLDASGFIKFRESGVDIMAIDGGNVGIGTTSPAQKLEIDGFILLQNNDEIRFKDTGGTERTAIELDGSNDLNIGTSAGGNLKFINGSSYTERMRITSAGNVGIGTTAPDTTRPLTIEGNSYGQIRVNNTSATKFGGLLSYNEIGKYGIFGVGGSNHSAVELRNNTFIEAINGSDISFRTGNSFSAVITSAGNVGIGTTSPTTKLDVVGTGKFTGQVTIPATPIATTDAASKSYVDAQSSTAMSVFSMLTCTTTTITSASDGVANAVVMKFDTEAITSGPSGSIVSYGSGGIDGIENSQFCWMNTASLLSRYFEFQWNVTSDTNTVTNRVLSGIRIEEGILEETTLSWSEISPTTSYIYDRGSGNIKKGSTAGSILISMPAGELKRYYRMVFWKEKASNNSVKSESVLNGTQITLKQLK